MIQRNYLTCLFNVHISSSSPSRKMSHNGFAHTRHHVRTHPTPAHAALTSQRCSAPYHWQNSHHVQAACACALMFSPRGNFP